MKKNIVMVTGDSGIALGQHNIFYEMLKEFSKYFETVHVITGSNHVGKPFVIHENVHIHPSDRSRFLRWDFWSHAGFVKKKILEINDSFPLAFVASHVIPPFFPGTRGAMRACARLGIPHFAEVMHIPGYPKAHGPLEVIEHIRMDSFLKKNHGRFSGIRIINKAELEPYLVNLGISKKELIHIPAFYLDFDTFKPRSIVRKPKQFVYAGRFETNKNIFALLNAFEAISKEDDEVNLIMIGEGTLSGKVKEWAYEHRLSDKIKLLGWLPTLKDVAKLYSESVALIMPSFSEGGPRVTLEAMACETLVLSTPVGIMKEVIRDGENCLQIDWSAEDIEKKMRFVLEHPKEVRVIAERGCKSVQGFEYHSALRYYAQNYLSLLY